MESNEREPSYRAEYLAVHSDIADSLRALRRLATVVTWCMVAIFIGFFIMAATSFIRLMTYP